jgi:hypothetical protein
MKPSNLKNTVSKVQAVNKILPPDQQSSKHEVKESNFKSVKGSTKEQFNNTQSMFNQSMLKTKSMFETHFSFNFALQEILEISVAQAINQHADSINVAGLILHELASEIIQNKEDNLFKT